MKDLYLFDIDGTLVNINDVHLKAYKLDYFDVLKRDVPDKFITAAFGMSGTDAHKYVLNKLGIPHDNILIKRIIDCHASNFKKIIEETNVKPLKGSTELLSFLKKEKNYIAVITGNLEKPAKLILNKSGLIDFFDYIICDDGKSSRKQIVQNAIDEAKRRKYDFKRIIVIGDTTYDIEAGKNVKAITIGVATGSDNLNKLKEKNPDLLLSSLTDYNLILELLKKKT